ncbi:MAG: arylamine N-acetyltransferase [Eggerthellaceae bacterium]|nr:arylamine N-acetyltransferase [Eggerthellaceae bacterium]
MFTEDQVQAYLERIGFEGDVRVCKETLDELVFCHQKSVPFETYDVHVFGQAPALDEDSVFQKIVERRRGGYCFELNKGFELLLKGLGFDARPVLSRAVRGRDGRMPINHRGMVVSLDGVDYSLDVGFGGPMPAGALALVDGLEQDIRGELYTPRNIDGMWWAVDRVTRSTHDFFDDGVPMRKQTELELCLAKVEDLDFGPLNTAFSQPGTLFRDFIVCNLRLDNGHYALKDYVLTVREDGQKSVIEFANDEELKAGLLQYFGMAV